MSNCGCNNSNSGDDGEYLMIKASAKSASTCGGSTAVSDTNSCAKQEPEFDYALNGFIIPLAGNQASIGVCNGSVYSVGQWIQFISPLSFFKITSNVGNVLTLVNQCPDGNVVAENPLAGQAIAQGSAFYVVPHPPCKSLEQRVEEVNSALAEAEQICVPALAESSETAWVQPVGRIEADPGDTSFRKCIRRIRGIIFKAGKPFLTLLKDNINFDTIGGYKRVGIDPVTKEVVQLPDYGDADGLESDEQYGVAVRTSGDKVVGPVAFFSPVDLLVVENGVPLNTASWTSFTTSLTVNNSLNIAGITGVRKYKDHYHALVHISMTMDESLPGAGGTVYKVELNSELIAYHTQYAPSTGNGRRRWLNMVIPIKVMVNTNNLELVVTHTDGGVGGSVKVYYRIGVKGIYV